MLWMKSAPLHLPADARLAEYQPYWAARAEVLARSGAYAGARQAFAITVGLEDNPAVRQFLEQRQSLIPDR